MGRSSTSEIKKMVNKITYKTRKKYKQIRINKGYLSDLDKRQIDYNNYADLTESIRHLTYHVYPLANSNAAWEWNIEQLKKRWALFNGKKILGINYSNDTISPDDFLYYCYTVGISWDHVVIKRNDVSLGEVLTWVPSLNFLDIENAQENELVFSAHAKGVKYGEEMPKVIKDWSNVMYSANLDNWNIVKTSLEWFSATGAFRARWSKDKFCKYGWYYSGSFWWWRAKDVGKNKTWSEVRQFYPGRELWIGNQMDKISSDCIFMDNTKSPYSPEYWQKTILPDWKKFNEISN